MKNELLNQVIDDIAANFGIGVSEIAKERHEQIKHGFSLEKDAEYYKKGELVEAARFCLGVGLWPRNWDIEYRNKILYKPMVERFKIAASLLAAEIDRLKSL